MSKTLSLKKPLEAESVSRPGDGACDIIGPQAVTFETHVDHSPVPPAIPTYTADQLRAMLAELEPAPARAVTDPTMDLSIDLLPPHEVVDTSHMPPPDQRASAPVSPPAGVHGVFGIGGIALIAPGVVPSNVDPSTGKIYTQPGTRAPTQIQVPPQQFGRRRQ